MAQNNTPTTLTPEQQAQLLALVETLRKEKDAAEKALAEEKAKKASKVSLKISERGAVSLYGLGRFPFSPYRSQWIRIFELKDMIMKFIEDNKDVLDMVEEEREEKAAAEKAARIAALPAAPTPAQVVKAQTGKLDYATWRAQQAKK